MATLQTKLDQLKATLAEQLSSQFSDDVLSLGISLSELKVQQDLLAAGLAKVTADLSSLAKLVSEEQPPQIQCPKCAHRFPAAPAK